MNGRFAELGVERSEGGGSTTWTASPDGEIRIDSPLVQMAGPNTLNNVRTGPGSFASSATDVICAARGTEAMRDHVTGRLADGKSPRTGQPWSELLPNAKVELLTGSVPTVRVTATPGSENPPGRPVQMLMAAELSELLGS